MGATVDEWRSGEQDDFVPDPDSITRWMNRHDYRVVFLCNPNNPTGQILSQDILAFWSEAFPYTLFVIDEAYISFTTRMPSSISLSRPNLLILRSMTKDYALTGLRLGFAVSHSKVIEALRKVRPPWNVNAMAQSAGIAALDDPAHLDNNLAKLAQAKQELIAALHDRGFNIFPTNVQFFLMKVGNGARLRTELRSRGILVRDCTSFGLPDYIRIATLRPEENARLLAALDEVL